MGLVRQGRVSRAIVAFYLMVGMMIVIPGSSAVAAPPLCDGKPATIVGTPDDDVLMGTSGPDVIVGLGGNDTLWGGSGVDTLCGGNGDDLLVGGEFNDVLFGGNGSDTVSYLAATHWVAVHLLDGEVWSPSTGRDSLTSIENVIGSPYGDYINGNGQPNVLNGAGGDDNIYGYGGDDTLLGGDGDDRLAGLDGDDDLRGGGGFDTATYQRASSRVSADLGAGIADGIDTGTDQLTSIEGLEGSPYGDDLVGDWRPNRLMGWGGNDWIDGRGGADALTGFSGMDKLLGGPGDDVIVGSLGEDDLRGGLGDDVLRGGPDDDEAWGGLGNDVLVGGAGVDVLRGGPGEDEIAGEGDDDEIRGGADDDLLVGGSGDDTIVDVQGFNTLAYPSATGPLTVDLAGAAEASGRGVGTDQLLVFAASRVIGSEYDDWLRGSASRSRGDILEGRGGDDVLLGSNGPDTLVGGAGNDQLDGGIGNDVIEGGPGTDIASFTSLPGGVAVDVMAGEAVSNHGTDALSGVVDVRGTAHDDNIRGNNAANTLLGWGGDDLIEGRDGDDLIEGHAGSDDLGGGRGEDAVYGHSGDDLVRGGYGDDILDGGTGTDIVRGGGGNDACRYGETYISCESLPGEPSPIWGPLPWPSLSGISFVDEVPTELQEPLKADGFVIEDYQYGRHAAPIYDSLFRYGGRSLFVTTDAVYHHWHLVFDKILRDTEQERLLPVLESLVLDLLAAARTQTGELAGTELADAALRVEEYLEAAATVLELDVGPIGPRAEEEVQLVNEHVARTASPTVGGICSTQYPSGCVDYSRMKPRGHYTRSEELTRYFKAMSILGNVGFGLDQLDPFRVGLLLTRLIVEDAAITADWERIYQATAVLVGASDDYTPYEAEEAATGVAPGWLGDPVGLVSDVTVEEIAAELLAMRPVRIDPEAASLRAMGVRFIFDSYILDQLAAPNVTDRGYVSALDVAAAFGSDWALDRQHENDPTTTDPDYVDQMAAMRDQVEARTQDDWSATVYDSWLSALQALFLPTDSEGPPFMLTDVWQAKSHQTGFGSYAELKHDTILYGKEGTAEGDSPIPPEVLHWVEPDPLALGRITRTAELMHEVLDAQGLLPEGDNEFTSLRAILEDWIQISARLEQIAAYELANGRPSAVDADWLDSIGPMFVNILERTGTAPTFVDPFAAVIADIFLNGFTHEVLEEGTGEFDLIHVIVPDTDGFQVATGAVYSYYEFWQPRTNRLTDEQWWEMIKSDELPPRPFWVEEYLGL